MPGILWWLVEIEWWTTPNPCPQGEYSFRVYQLKVEETHRNDETHKVDKLGASVFNSFVQMLMDEKLKQYYWSPIQSETVDEGLHSRTHISGGLGYFWKWDAMARRKVGRNTYSLLSSVLPTVNLTVTRHLKNPVLALQNNQGTVGNGLWGACGITNQMAFQNEGIMCLKNNIMSPFLTKEGNCMKSLIDFFCQIIHIKTLHGVSARTDSIWNAERMKWEEDHRMNSNQSVLMMWVLRIRNDRNNALFILL